MSHIPTVIIAPKLSRAKHFGYVLLNGAKCIVIQDPSPKMPVAAMCINAGQLNDPEYLPGLAHFCEHMLFMGTEKFTKENEYDAYISRHNGVCNAFTSNFVTTYYFQVSDEGLEGALERFLDFFVAPSFNASAVGREVQAVHSEDEKNHSVDYWRVDEFYRSLHNRRHPRHRYGNGNYTTLVEEPRKENIDLREELKKFYSKYYLSESACIVVYSTRTPEAVLKLIEGPLMNMKVGAQPSFRFLDPASGLFEKGSTPSWVNIRTLRRTRELYIVWPVRSPSSLWKSIPSSYISHSLGHECNTSVLGVLKSKNFATGMVAGPHRADDDFDTFHVSVTLTLKGFKHVNEIIELIYECIGQSIHAGIQKDVYEEMKNEERLRFESSEVSGSASHCVELAMSALMCDLEHAWIGDTVLLEDDYEACLRYAKQLTPQNSVVFLKWEDFPAFDHVTVEEAKPTAAEEEEQASSHDEEDIQVAEDGASADDLFLSLPVFAQRKVDKVMRFHKAAYSQVRIPDTVIDSWTQALQPPYSEALGLPALNPYVASDFTVFPPENDGLGKAVSCFFQHGTIVVRKDTGHHNTFKCALRVLALSPVAYASPLHRLYTQVACYILKDSLTELSYYGELASLTNEVVPGQGAISVIVCGPYQHLIRFFHAILLKLFDLDTLEGTQDKYSIYTDQYLRKLHSMRTLQPYELCLERLSKISVYLLHSFEELLGAAPSASYDGYKSFVTQYLGAGFRFECFVAGNVPCTEGIKCVIASEIEEALSRLQSPVPDAGAIPRFRDSLDVTLNAVGCPAGIVASLDVVAFPPFNPLDPNVCVTLDICLGAASARNKALANVAEKLLSSHFFDALRTKEAVGYVVFCKARCFEQSAHILFLVQSALDDVNSLYLLSRIVAFLVAVEHGLECVCTAEYFKSIQAGLILSLEKLPSSVCHDAESMEIDYMSLSGLDNRAEQIAAIKSLSLGDLKDFFLHYLLNCRTGTRGLAVIVDSARCEFASPFTAKGAAGKKLTLELPPKRASGTDDTLAERNEGDLALPTFEGGAARIEVECFDSIAFYRQGRRVVRSHTF